MLSAMPKAMCKHAHINVIGDAKGKLQAMLKGEKSEVVEAAFAVCSLQEVSASPLYLPLYLPSM